MIDDIKKFFIGLCYIAGCYLIILGLAITYIYSKKLINNKDTIKENVILTDSIIKINDSIKIKVDNLDSIKNAKVIEVKTLDNDSTIKLFYKLIK